MKNRFLAHAAIGVSVAAMLPAAAMAQATGAEVVGQPIQVTTNGVTNTVYLDAGGQLRIITLTSSCGSSETWLASGTNQAPPPTAVPERGR